MVNTSDLLPQASGSASIGVEQNARGLTSNILPYASFHANSGILHNEIGSSGIVRFGGPSKRLEFSKDGGRIFDRLLLESDNTILSAGDEHEVLFAPASLISLFDSSRSFLFNKRFGGTLGISGVLDLSEISTPTAGHSGITSFYGDKFASYPGINIRGSGVMQQRISSFLQSSLINKVVFWVTPRNATALDGYGPFFAANGTVSHATATPGSGRLASMATAVGAGNTAGVASTNAIFARGTVSGVNSGFFFTTRINLPDASYTSALVFVGLGSDTAANSVASADPAGSYVGFQYSTARGDTAWRLMTKDGTTQSLTTTNIGFSQNILYDMHIYCPPFPNNSVIYWEIENVTYGIVDRGQVTSNLPLANTLLRPIIQINNVSATARNIGFLSLYTENVS